MIDHRSLKELARTSRVRLTDLIAMGPNNDPFLADRPSRRIGAEWFADLYRQFGFGQGVHLRRIHYRIISAPAPIRKPDAKDYENTEQCWDYLVSASRDARYLGLVPSGCFVDRRNPDPLIFYEAEQDIGTSVDGGSVGIDAPSDEFPDLPSYRLENWYDLKPPSPYLLEVWIEKTTMQDVLVPLCQPRGVNLIPGAGELSETRTHELLERAIAAKKPVRIFYISDFDPGGRCMPVSVSRRIEFYLRQGGIDLDLRLIPLALTHHQCVEYALPRTPIKDTEARGGLAREPPSLMHSKRCIPDRSGKSSIRRSIDTSTPNIPAPSIWQSASTALV